MESRLWGGRTGQAKWEIAAGRRRVTIGHEVRMRRWSARLALLAIVVATIGCDQVAKHVAAAHLAGGPPQSYFGGAFRLEYAENTGGFLSLGAELPAWARVTIFSVGNGILLVGCLVAVFRH